MAEAEVPQGCGLRGTDPPKMTDLKVTTGHGVIVFPPEVEAAINQVKRSIESNSNYSQW